MKNAKSVVGKLTSAAQRALVERGYRVEQTGGDPMSKAEVLRCAAVSLQRALAERAGESPATYALLRTALDAVGHAMAWQVAS